MAFAPAWLNLSFLVPYAYLIFAFLCIYVAAKAAFNLYFHPLSRFPGPRFAAVSMWWQAYVDLWEYDSLCFKLVDVHALHGDIVRIGPNELHFSQPSAYHDIYSPRNRWTKGSYLYNAFVNRGSRSMFSILDYEPAKERRDLTANLFSRKSILGMQDLVQACIDEMCANIDEHIANKTPIHFKRAFRCCTLVTISSFCFGQTTNALSTPEFRSPLEHSIEAALPMLRVFKHIPISMKIINNLPPSLLMYLKPGSTGHLEVVKMLLDQIHNIFANPQTLVNSDHPTIFHELMEAKDPSVLSERVFFTEAWLYLFAGTDTSSDALTAGTLHVLGDPAIHQKLVQELREAWPKLDERPRYEDLESLPYLRAVIKESLRFSHGVTTPLTRVVPPEGAVISGQFIPGGTVVSMSNVFVHTNAEIFPEPDAFRPERWLDPSAGSLDNWLVAFGKGPRSCIGMNLAYCEMFLAFTNLFRRYDMRLNGVSPADWRWVDQFSPVYVGPPLELWAQARSD
ncbi:cytochrome P450 [Phanerochaete sordida]|uniref:Cytochrome P450 n=1 Tax=Phanerochaete sordida TaxID=48140 RepID=A0A9P3G3R5_9APHY|nr:cytochrome P450 [Phanerochaete sordida]